MSTLSGNAGFPSYDPCPATLQGTSGITAAVLKHATASAVLYARKKPPMPMIVKT
jgi:hypothetical protein